MLADKSLLILSYGAIFIITLEENAVNYQNEELFPVTDYTRKELR
jgi:hypothetical protein